MFMSNLQKCNFIPLYLCLAYAMSNKMDQKLLDCSSWKSINPWSVWRYLNGHFLFNLGWRNPCILAQNNTTTQPTFVNLELGGGAVQKILKGTALHLACAQRGEGHIDSMLAQLALSSAHWKSIVCWSSNDEHKTLLHPFQSWKFKLIPIPGLQKKQWEAIYLSPLCLS